MQKYIKTVVEKIIKSNTTFNNTKIILPSKRAGVFVKNEIKNKLKTFQFLPEIISIEDFIIDISGIDTVDNLVLLFEFYKIYLENTNKDKIESFEDFSSWATILITDFNEIDSYLIDTKDVFSYLKDINRIENWFKDKQSLSELTKKYIHFFEKIEIYYKKFYQYLLNLKIGYQGLQYREANSKINQYIKDNNESKFIFIGFNALNKAEENIIQLLLENKQAEIYFDIDVFLINEKISASNFIKTYKEKWNYFTYNDFNKVSDNFKNKKNISIIGIPKNVSQIKYATEIIQKDIDNLDNTALILANEDLLTTTINSLPTKLKSVNITMGLPLKNILYTDLFHSLFKMHQNKSKLGNNDKFYHKDILSVLNHPALNNTQHLIIDIIQSNNYIFLNKSDLLDISSDENKEFLNKIFEDWNNCNDAIKYCFDVITGLKNDDKSDIELEYLNRFEQIFNQIDVLNSKYNYIKTLDGLANIFTQILNSETLSFKGEALKGLQIMGMLETRVLEFESIILTSVNEGFLPAGKSNNSFIPFDIKGEFGLPTYREKDAIFSYHFFRLIARAKNIYLLYNTEPDDFGSGEQSRFVTQLEYFQYKLPNHTLTKTIVSPKMNSEQTELKRIKKDDLIIDKLINEAKKGFAPTTLTNYIYNPIAFYKQKILRIRQLDEIEETIAANTLGTVVHEVLDKFYRPFINKFIIVDDVLAMKKQVDKKVNKEFEIVYENGDISKGKNLLIFEISKQYVINFLNQEIKLLRDKSNKLRIISIEENLYSTIKIEGFEVKLKGKVDRIDELNGVIRIIDYKTGLVKQADLNLETPKSNNWDRLIIDHKYSKAFQVLMYAYMYIKKNNLSLDSIIIESGIISFKNLKSGFMKVNKSSISQDNIDEFEDNLKQLLQEIFNKEIPFIENENLPY